jgi:hypothetical protein
MDEAAAFVRSALGLAWISFAALLVLTYRQLTAAAARDAQGAAARAAKDLANPAALQVDAKALVDFDPTNLFGNASKAGRHLGKGRPGSGPVSGVGSFPRIAAYGIQEPSGGTPRVGGTSSTTEMGQKRVRQAVRRSI